MSRWTYLRPPDAVALAGWVAAVALFGVAAAVGNDTQCDYDNRDTYVAASRWAGLALAGVAAALATAGAFLTAGARSASGRGRLLRGAVGVVSFSLAAVTAFVALLELFAFGCLE